MMKRYILVPIALTSLAACATIEKGKETVCAKKAEAIQAAQSVIDALNAYCPVEEAAKKEMNNVSD